MVAGEINFPDYMKDYHQAVMGTGDLTRDVTQVINAAMASGGNPFESMTTNDPDADLSAIIAAVGDYYTLVNGIDHVTDWKSIVDQSGYNTDGIDAYDQMLTDQLEANTLPKFNAGMRNIGAVMTSAFAIGQGVIYSFKNREVAKYASDLSREGVQQMIALYGSKIDAVKGWMAAVIEARRIKIVADKETIDSQHAIDEAEAKWELELFQYAGNVLAAISGAPSISKGGSQVSQGRSAIGGALSGAALGAGIGSKIGEGNTGWGALAGAAAGAAMSFF